MMRVLCFLLPTVLAELTQVHVFPPDQLISEPSGNATFYCISSVPTISFQWYLNGSLLLGNLSNIMTKYSADGNGIGILQFTNLPQSLSYDRVTDIQCEARFYSGISKRSNITSHLLIRDHTPLVVDLMVDSLDSIITINWTTPNVTPRITGYCVDVVSSSIQYSECGINVTEFSYPIPPRSVCLIILFTVTHMDILGFEAEETEAYFGAETRPEVIEVSKSLINQTLTIIITMSAPMCSYELTFEDHNTEDIIPINTVTVESNMITVPVTQLSANRHYNVTIVANNVIGTATSYINMSTHDIMDATVREIQENEVEIKASYFPHSNARGVFLKFIFITDGGNVDFSRSVLLILDRNTSQNYTTPFYWHPGQFQVLIYDIEQDGTLSSGVGYPAVTHELVTHGNTHDAPSFQPTLFYIESCGVNTATSHIRVQCSYPGNSLAIGFQMIAQLTSNSSQVHKLYVNQTTDLRSSASVVVEETGTYQVAIFAIRGGMGILGSNVEYTEEVAVSAIHTVGLPTEPQVPEDSNSLGIILGASVGGACAVLIVLLILIMVLFISKSRQKGKHTLHVLQGQTYSDMKIADLTNPSLPLTTLTHQDLVPVGDSDGDEIEGPNISDTSGPRDPLLSSNSSAEGERQVEAEIDDDTQSINVHTQESGENEETLKNTENREMANQAQEPRGKIVQKKSIDATTDEKAPEDLTDDRVTTKTIPATDLEENLDKIPYVAISTTESAVATDYGVRLPYAPISRSKKLPYVSSSDDGTARETEATSSNRIVTNVKPHEETNESKLIYDNMPLLSATRDNYKIDEGPVVRPAPSPEPDHALPRFQQCVGHILSNQDQVDFEENIQQEPGLSLAPEHVADSSGQECSVELPLTTPSAQEPEQSLAPSAEGTPPALEPESGVQQEGEQSATSSSSQNNPQFDVYYFPDLAYSHYHSLCRSPQTDEYSIL